MFLQFDPAWIDKHTVSIHTCTNTDNSCVLFTFLCHFLIGADKWATTRQKEKKMLKCVFAILCGTCLIQRITAQYALLIPLALCTTSIPHHIYLVFIGLTQILQCWRDSLLKLLGFKSHPFFSTTLPLAVSNTQPARAGKPNTRIHYTIVIKMNQYQSA